MEVVFRAKSFELRETCSTQTEAFGFLGDCAEVLSIQCCGACKSENIVPEHRTAKGFDFYGWKCLDCHHKLRYGITKEDHRLFPKKKGDNGEWLPNGGWIKEEFNREQQAQPQQQASRSAPAVPF